MRSRPSSGLADVSAGVYTLLVIYASLYPFTGWRSTGAPVTAFLTAAWPRYWTVFDLVVNVLGYAPLGFLWAAALRHSLNRWLAAALALLLGAGLSLSMETLQNFLPSRVSSNVDLGCNSLGALLGTLAGVRWGAALLDGGRIGDLRNRLVLPGRVGDFGLLLLGFWLVAQLNPEILLFGTGDLRRLLELPAPMPFSAERFTWLETAIACAGTLAVGLLGAVLLKQGRRLPLLVGFVGASLAIRMLAQAILFGPGEYLQWLTPGNGTGVALGTLLLVAASPLPRGWQRALGALTLMVATALVNLAPENPYLAETFQNWQQGQFLNFNGLTRLASSLWPFLALTWLMAPAGPKRRE